MPFIGTKTTCEISNEKEIVLKQKLGKAISLIPGKSEVWLMTSFEDNCHMYFKGENNADMAFIEVKIFGGASDKAYDDLTAEITKIFNDELKISTDKIYIKYEEVGHWGWNGSNF